MLPDSLLALAAVAGRMVATAVDTEAWETARCGFAQLLGRGDVTQTQIAERRLDETRKQLTDTATTDMGRTRAALAGRWAGRLEDLLEENPGTQADLRTLVREIQATLQAEMVSASDHLAADGFMNVNAADHEGSINVQALPAAELVEADLSVTALSGVAGGDPADHRPQLEVRPVRLAPRPVFLAGREVLFAELEARLGDSQSPSLRTVILRGPGGSGKTSVAVEYAHRVLAKPGLVWQFDAGDATVLAAEFGALAAQLGVRDVLDVEDPAASVHRIFAAFSAEWLLLFDDAPDMASVEAFIPRAGRGRVLITTQNQFWPDEQTLDVPVLDPEVGAEFLINRTGDPSWQVALELAGSQELSGLPLALEHTAAYVLAAEDSLAGYLASFRQQRASLPARGKASGHSDIVAATWSLAFERLRQAYPDAAALLKLLACCGSAAIPVRMLLQLRPGLTEQLPPRIAPVLLPLLEDQLAATDAVAALRRYSLIGVAADGAVTVHRLVQAVTLDHMRTELREWQQATAHMIEAALPPHPEQPQSWPYYAALLPHARAVLAPDSPGMAQFVSYLCKSGSYAAVRELGQEVLEARTRVLGPEHPDTLAAWKDLAHWTGQAGDAAGARDQFAALVPVRERVLGSEHPDTLTARLNLAYWTGSANDEAGARDQFTALIPLVEQVLGPEHPDTLATRHQLAYWTGEAGDAVTARDQFAALVPLHERALGLDHPETLATRHQLAYWAASTGDVAWARDQFAALLTVTERVLGPEHPDTLAIRNSLDRL